MNKEIWKKALVPYQQLYVVHYDYYLSKANPWSNKKLFSMAVNMQVGIFPKYYYIKLSYYLYGDFTTMAS